MGPEGFLPPLFFCEAAEIWDLCGAEAFRQDVSPLPGFFGMRGHELEKVLSLAAPLAASMGFEILKAEFGSEHGDTVLRIYLDRSEGQGVTVGDCEDFSRNLGTILDVEAELPGRYYLEISSPGLNRPLATPKHFRAQVGKIVDVHTAQAIEGRRHFKGELLEAGGEGVEDGWVTLLVDSRSCRIPVSEIRKAHLDYFASEEKENPSLPGKKGRKLKKGNN